MSEQQQIHRRQAQQRFQTRQQSEKTHDNHQKQPQNSQEQQQNTYDPLWRQKMNQQLEKKHKSQNDLNNQNQNEYHPQIRQSNENTHAQQRRFQEPREQQLHGEIHQQKHQQKREQTNQNDKPSQEVSHTNQLNQRQRQQKLIQVSASEEFQNIQLSQSNDLYEVLQTSKSNFSQRKEEIQQNNQIQFDKPQENQNIQPQQQGKLIKNQARTQQVELKNQQPAQQKVQQKNVQKQISTEIKPVVAESIIKEQPINIKHFQNKINQAINFKAEGNEHFKVNQFQQAIKKYSQGLRVLDPKAFYGATAAQLQKMAELSANLLLNIGSCFFSINIWRNAQIYFSQAITINPSYTKAIYKRALCRYQLQNYESAMQDIKLAFAQDKSNKDIYASYEKILIKYNQQVKKDKENMKEMSSKIFRSDSQKSLSAKSQKGEEKLNNSQVNEINKEKDNKQIEQGPSELWSLAPIALVIGVGLFWGYKKFFGKP